MKKAVCILVAAALALSMTASFGCRCAKAAPAPSYTDVPEDEWYYGPVKTVTAAGLMDGVGGALFRPETETYRAILVTALYRLAGSPKIKAAAETVKFSDVSASDWFYAPAEWAADTGVAVGYGNGTFGVYDSLTRAETAAMLMRYAAASGISSAGTADLSRYADAGDVADWAREPMGWAVSAGMINGADGMMLLPDGLATRAETAAVLSRYLDMTALVKRTAGYIGQFEKDDMSAFMEDCSDGLRQSITESSLKGDWDSLSIMTELSGGVTGSVCSAGDGGRAVVSTLSGTIYDMTVKITYGADGAPSDISLGYGPKTPPEPEASDKWEEKAVKVGEMALPGMLTLPKDVKNPPVVILIQGSSASDMDEASGYIPLRPMRDIARALAEKGVASLRYNKRTYQYPQAECVSVQYEILDDASAAVKLLASDGRVDPERIYIAGHSLGGMMAPKIAADNPEIKGMISLAGSLRTLQEVMLDEDAEDVESDGSLTEAEKEAELKSDREDIEKTLTLDDGGSGYIMMTPTSYWKSLNEINGEEITDTLTIPMLLMQGTEDTVIFPDRDFVLWQTRLDGRDNAEFRTYAGLNHLFMLDDDYADKNSMAGDYYDETHVSAEVPYDIADWINGLEG